MVRCNAPEYLIQLSTEASIRHLVQLSKRLGDVSQQVGSQRFIYLVRTLLRPYFQCTLPASIRVNLLNESAFRLSHQSLIGLELNYGKSILTLLNLLLCNDTKTLNVTLCCYYGCSDMEILLKTISQFGAGLTSLCLLRSSLLRIDNDLFTPILVSSNLQTLSLQNICTDSALKAIGTSCRNLMDLDVSNSKQLSDSGVRSLCLEIEFTDDHFQNCKRSQPNSTRLATLFQMCHSLISCLPKPNTVNSEILLQLQEKRNACCESLATLNLAGTAVSIEGVLIALRNVSNLTSLGKFTFSGRMIESLSLYEELKPLNLKSLFLARTNAQSLNTIIHKCPHVKHLTMSVPMQHIAAPLKSLTSLKVFHLNHDIEGGHPLRLNIYLFLSENGYQLEELKLKFLPTLEGTPLDFSVIINGCPFVVKLQCESFMISNLRSPVRFSSPYFENESFNHLTYLELGRIVQTEVLLTTMQCTPQLRVAHFYCCPDLTDSELREIDEKSAQCLHTLECFFIYSAPHITVKSFDYLIGLFPSLSKIGNIHQWAVDCDGVRLITDQIRNDNLDLKLLTGSHWFSSKCALSC